MWIVRLALRRPYTFVVVAFLIAILGVAAIITMPVDIFPYIDIPVVSVVWTYTGLSTQDMEKQITTFSEFSTSFAVNNIKNIESQTLNGVGGGEDLLPTRRRRRGGRDFGHEVEVVSGLGGEELLIASPGDRLVEGQTVQVAASAVKAD